MVRLGSRDAVQTIGTAGSVMGLEGPRRSDGAVELAEPAACAASSIACVSDRLESSTNKGRSGLTAP